MTSLHKMSTDRLQELADDLFREVAGEDEDVISLLSKFEEVIRELTLREGA